MQSFLHFTVTALSRNSPILLVLLLFASLLALFRLFFSVLRAQLLSMAFAHCLLAVPVDTSNHPKTTIPNSFSSPSAAAAESLSLSLSSFSIGSNSRKLSIFPRLQRIGHKAKAKAQESEVSLAADAFTHFKHLLLPITDRNPYLSEGTRQAAATTAALAKKYGADITVVVIDEKQKESFPEHETQMSSIRWHLSEGGFQEFNLLERLGEGNKPTAIIGDVADDLNLDLVVISMEAIHSKHVDANLLAEFIPCPVLLLPL
ncbi:hypothetical protein P3X46_029141 [Hevea brasiliensis]|uniref:UspA domain-containing protein n=1 Tax=Hevea brasiliensis TaxID=3981 RepID=A0ABQ9KUD2_HEVBR|nr:uncharacterized protein LOC110647081 [Hevea brasiliensis]KAJ9146928.1 hypothetical protein P3X46_029141 [Hevea brasiliensis]